MGLRPAKALEIFEWSVCSSRFPYTALDDDKYAT